MWVFGLAALVAAVGASVAWALHLFSLATQDSVELATKLAVPNPRRTADWPEVRVDEVVFDPVVEGRVLVLVRWPAHPEIGALLARGR